MTMAALYTHTVMGTHSASSAQIHVEVKSLLIAFHGVDGCIMASVDEAGRCRERKNTRVVRHTQRVWHTFQPTETVIS